MFRKMLALAAVLLIVSAVYAQQKTAEDDAKLEKGAIELLRDTSAEVGRLRSLENRISFNAELASLMWYHDDKEAKAMYGAVVAEFKQLLSQFDAQMNSVGDVEEQEYSSGGIFGSYGRSKIERKFQIAMGVRKQIALSLADHAPDLAYNFYFDSISAITNPKFRKQAEENDRFFESQLINRIAEADAAKAIEYGKESMKAGLDNRHIDLLKKIWAKDVDKGIEFGAVVLGRLRSQPSKERSTYVSSSLLSFGSSNYDAAKKASKKPVYEQNELREIAEMFAALLLEDPEISAYTAAANLELIGRYAPARATQIKAKLSKQSGNANMQELKTIATSMGTDHGTGSDPGAAKRRQEEEARAKLEKELNDSISNVGADGLKKEERDKAIARARQNIAATPGKDKRIVALSQLAAQVARTGDKDLAADIMRDAERLVEPQPRNYRDFLMSWMLAAGYAESDPEKAFPLLESTILRANDTINAFIKVAEFADVNDELIDDGEIQVGMFGGEMIRGITGGLAMSSVTIRSLARADLAKTRNLTNTFERSEIRVLAKMLVLRAVLEKKKADQKIEDELLNETLPGE